MARNGSGTYNLPAGNPVVTGTAISSTWANNTLGDMATALTGSIAADGQTTPSANLPMGNYAHTGVGNATVRTMYSSAGQVQDNVFQYLTSTSGADTITAVAAFGMTSYATGQCFTFIAAGTNTGAATLNINSIGAKALTKNGTTALAAGDIQSGMAVSVFYDGTRFQMIAPAITSYVKTFSAGTTGLTPSAPTSGAVTLAGTLSVANGGTGLTTLTANNVILGNGTSNPTFVAPSTSGNLLTSNGTTWQSTAPAMLGIGQTWQSVTGSRAFGTSYQNTTGKPIMAALSITGGSSSAVAQVQISTDNSTWVTIANLRAQSDQDVNGDSFSWVVPNNQYYKAIIAANNPSIVSWAELR